MELLDMPTEILFKIVRCYLNGQKIAIKDPWWYHSDYRPRTKPFRSKIDLILVNSTFNEVCSSVLFECVSLDFSKCVCYQFKFLLGRLPAPILSQVQRVTLIHPFQVEMISSMPNLKYIELNIKSDDTNNILLILHFLHLTFGSFKFEALGIKIHAYVHFEQLINSNPTGGIKLITDHSGKNKLFSAEGISNDIFTRFKTGCPECPMGEIEMVPQCWSANGDYLDSSLEWLGL